jgi:hypothetical protein
MRPLGVTTACVGTRVVARMNFRWDTILVMVAEPEAGKTSPFLQNAPSMSFAQTKGPSASQKFKLVNHVNSIVMVRDIFDFDHIQ